MKYLSQTQKVSLIVIIFLVVKFNNQMYQKLQKCKTMRVVVFKRKEKIPFSVILTMKIFISLAIDGLNPQVRNHFLRNFILKTSKV